MRYPPNNNKVKWVRGEFHGNISKMMRKKKHMRKIRQTLLYFNVGSTDLGYKK